ncbi:MAG: TonB-dependent receptor [Blastocatellia bacterium]|nr:TonB-dependent receptor [Blastocatellia bacterium]
MNYRTTTRTTTQPRQQFLAWPVLLALFLLTSLTLSAQTFRGGISGTINDDAGAAIPAASIKATNKATGVARNVETGKNGEFVIPELPLGFYTIEVGKTGFQTARVNDVEVVVSTNTAVNLQLRVAAVTETVEISAESVVRIDTASTALTGIIGPKQVQELPLNGRDFRQMIQLTPGVAGTSTSINGSRTRGNNYQIDGADNNDAFQNTSAVNQGGVSGIAGTLLPVEAIDQFSVLNNGSAEIGRNSGGAVNLVIKSGTNNLHGSAYYFNRNEALAANSPVRTGLPVRKVRNHQYGFSLGGPILKNKTFYFLTFEGQRAKAANSELGTVPSTAWINQALPLLNGKYTTTAGAPVVIPVNPVSQRLLGLFPSAANGLPASVNNYLGSDESIYDSDNGIVKLDHVLSERHNLNVRYFGGTGAQTAYDGSPLSDYFQTAPSRMHNFSFIENSVWSPKLVSQLVIGVNYFKQTFDVANISQDAQALGLITNASRTGPPAISISGFARAGGSGLLPAGRIDTTWHITDTFTWTLNNHQLKFGGEVRRAYLDIFYDSFTRGQFFFDGSRGPWRTDTTVSSQVRALADFLAGFVRPNNGATILRGSPARDYRQNSVDWFAHDTWKATPNLTLNYGVRFTYNGPLYDVDNSIANFDPANGFSVVGKDSSVLYRRDWNNYAPRVGFAYSFGKSERTVLRGGYGIYYDLPAASFFTSNTPGNQAASGIGNNPAGPSPVFTINRGNAAGNYTPDYGTGVQIFGSTLVPPYGVFGVSQDFRTPYVQNFNLNLQHQLARATVLQVGYVGALGRKLAITRSINAATPGTGTVQSRRPYNTRFPDIAAISLLESVGNSHYNSLQVSLNQGLRKGLSSQFAYTWAKSIDNASEARSTIAANAYNLRNERGASAFDVRHNFRANLAWDIPVPIESLPQRLTRGWQLNALLAFNTGTPLNITAGRDISGSGDNSDRVNLVGDPFAGVTQEAGLRGRRFLRRDAFAFQPAGQFGTLGRNVFYGPGFRSVDFSLFKTTQLTEKTSLQFRAEMFNAFNFVNWANPNTNLNAGAAFGVSTNTRNGSSAPGIGQGEPRNVQLALKLLF